MRPPPFIAAVSLAFLLGCFHRVPTGTVELIDTSLSITPRAEQAAMDAVRAEIGRMERGDILILVPITGDELNDAGGRILRLQAPTTRESYDADLQRFHKDATTRFAAWAAVQRAEPERTDILESLDLARQEIDSIPRASRRRLVVVSDFLEDDAQYRFTRDPALADPGRARVLASHLRGQHGFAIPRATLCLGRLESTDFPSLSPRRKESIGAFWAAYFAPVRREAVIQIDASGMLAGSDAGCFVEQP